MLKQNEFDIIRSMELDDLIKYKKKLDWHQLPIIVELREAVLDQIGVILSWDTVFIKKDNG